jgi:hypothetical protein
MIESALNLQVKPHNPIFEPHTVPNRLDKTPQTP